VAFIARMVHILTGCLGVSVLSLDDSFSSHRQQHDNTRKIKIRFHKITSDTKTNQQQSNHHTHPSCHNKIIHKWWGIFIFQEVTKTDNFSIKFKDGWNEHQWGKKIINFSRVFYCLSIFVLLLSLPIPMSLIY